MDQRLQKHLDLTFWRYHTHRGRIALQLRANEVQRFALRPGRELIRCLIGALLLSLGIFVEPAVMYLGLFLLVAIAVMALVDYQALRGQRKLIEVKRQLPSVVGRGDRFVVSWTMRLSRPFRVRGEWRDVAPSCCEPSMLFGKIELGADDVDCVWSREVRIPIRGEFSFGPFWVRISGPFGFLEQQWSLPLISSVKVLPETYCSRHELVKDAATEIRMLDKMVRARQQGVGTEFQSLAEFREGDDPRRIDWRSSARQGRPFFDPFGNFFFGNHNNNNKYQSNKQADRV